MSVEDSDVEVRHLRAALQNLIGYFNQFRPISTEGFEFSPLDKAEMVQSRRLNEEVIEVKVRPELVALEQDGSLVFRLTSLDLNLMLLELGSSVWQDETE